MRVFVPQDIYEIDKFSALQGVSVYHLMGNGGQALSKEVLQLLNTPLDGYNFVPDSSVLIVCGGGNNGGDGLAAAAKLAASGVNVSIILISEKPLNDICNTYYQLALSTGAKLVNNKDYHCYDIIVDALMGIGFKGELSNTYRMAIENINNSGAYIFSADIPSGVNGYNGRVNSVAVKADCVVTFVGYKTGLLLNDAKDFCHSIKVAEIGAILPNNLSDISTADELYLPERKQNSHKGNFASVRVLGGSTYMVGAPLLALEAGQAALRSGAGIVKLGVGNNILTAYQSRVRECMLYGFEADHVGKMLLKTHELEEFLQGADVLVAGMGMSCTSELKSAINYAINKTGLTLVLDAGALSCLEPDSLSSAKAEVIITPHPLEFARLTSLSVDEVLNDPINTAMNFARAHKCVVNLKGSSSTITDGKKVYIDYSGTPAMSKGGTGDVLSGVTAAFCAYMEPVKAAAYAAYVCSTAATLAEKELGQHSVIASDIIAKIPYVLSKK